MTERMISVPESALRALADLPCLPSANGCHEAKESVHALVACLPEPEPTFTDEEALAFYRAAFDVEVSDEDATRLGHKRLTALAKAGWTAPKALCPPPDDAEPSDDLLYRAWGVIANAHGGNWNEASDEWRGAAERWRDRWHEHLNAERGATPPPSPALVELVLATREVMAYQDRYGGLDRLRAAVAAYDEQEG